MTTQHIAPTVVAREDDGTELTHPAFALISASRFQASPGIALHGSDFIHQNAIALRIAPSVLHRHLSTDWHHAASLPHIEVQLSEAQWATFVSSLNVGGGVPCTVNHVNGKRVPALPPRETKAAFDREMVERLGKMSAHVRDTIASVEANLSNVSGRKREAVLASLHRLAQDVESNLPFVANQFDRHMEKTVEKAKTEVAAHIHSEIARAGLAALGTGQPLPLTLASGEVSDGE